MPTPVPAGVTRRELKSELETFASSLRTSIREDIRKEFQLNLFGSQAKFEKFSPLSAGDQCALEDESLSLSMKNQSVLQLRRVAQQERPKVNPSPRPSPRPLDKPFTPRELTKETTEAETILSSREMEYTLLPQQRSNGTPRSDTTGRMVPIKNWALSIVTMPAFEMVAGALVLLNCIEIGIEADAKTRGIAYPLSDAIELFFCIIFCAEITLRLCAVGVREYFCGAQWKWDWFDFTVVGIQVIDQGIEHLPKSLQRSHGGDVEMLRILRLLRLMRIVRLLRIVHMVHDLKVMASSMVNAFSALLWTMMLLFMLMYIWSIVCMEFITRAGQTKELPHHAQLQYYFGSLGRSMLTLFECIVGGISWDEIANPLTVDVSPWMGIAVIVYIIITCYAVTNMMTGMFVQKAMQFATDNQDRAQAESLRDLCFKPDEITGKVEEINWEKFKEMAEGEEMLDYFKSLNVDTSEARCLFDLLDADGGGMLDAEELVNGCLRLRGPAKALDLCLLMKEVALIAHRVEEVWSSVTAKEDRVSRSRSKSK